MQLRRLNADEVFGTHNRALSALQSAAVKINVAPVSAFLTTIE